MKKVFAAAIALALLASGTVAQSASAAEVTVASEAVNQENNLDDWMEKIHYVLTPSVTPDIPLRETPEGADLVTLWANELYNYKVIRSLPTAYETSTWEEYLALGDQIYRWTAETVTEANRNLIEQTRAARQKLKQVRPLQDAAWYIWDDDMPSAVSVVESDFTASSQDNADFRPFLVPYILENQEDVKGNMIIVSGGAYTERNNLNEGYPTAEYFNNLGYNCFVLQRRVAPYSMNDAWADMQRSIRYVRSKIDELGLGAADCIVGVGFSGGSGTVLGSIVNYYGVIQPNFDSSYTPDAIDRINSDLDIALLLYGPNYDIRSDYQTMQAALSESAGSSSDGLAASGYQGIVTDNTNLPAMFIASGSEDNVSADLDSLPLYRSVKNKTIVEMHIFANAPHGFGLGAPGTNSTYWPEMADSFIEKNRVLLRSNIVEIAQNVKYMEFPEGFTKYQTYPVDLSFGTVDVTLVTNDAEDEYLLYFSAFGGGQILAGNVLDGTPIMRYDQSGYFVNDNATLYNAHTDQWIAIQS